MSAERILLPRVIRRDTDVSFIDTCMNKSNPQVQPGFRPKGVLHNPGLRLTPRKYMEEWILLIRDNLLQEISLKVDQLISLNLPLCLAPLETKEMMKMTKKGEFDAGGARHGKIFSQDALTFT